ncbi:MAG: hypothetical protein ABIF09_12025 [Gemmatimonadota bacterium]
MSDENKSGRRTISAFFQIMRDETLTPEEKVLWGVYRSYENPTKGLGAFPGDQTLAEHMGKSVRSVQNYRAQLLVRGYLVQTLRGPRPAIYRAVLPDLEEDPEGEKLRNGLRTSESEDEASQKASQKASQPAAPEYGRVRKSTEKKLSDFESEAESEAVRDSLVRALPEVDHEAIQDIVKLRGLDPAEIGWLQRNFLEDPRGQLCDHEPEDRCRYVLRALRDLTRQRAPFWTRERFVSFLASLVAFEVDNQDGDRNVTAVAVDWLLPPEDYFDPCGKAPSEIYGRIVEALGDPR